MKKDKPIQHAAFIISLEHVRWDRNAAPVKRHTHEYPLITLIKVKDAIAFLTRYTDYAKYLNHDYLAMKQDLKDACFITEITNMELLEKEVLCMEYPDIQDFFKKHYDEHYISIHRVPCGPYRRVMYPDYIE